MDADISSAATQLDLDKISAQDYRNALASQQADRAAFRAIVSGMQAWIQSEYAKIPPEESPSEIRRQLTIELAGKYMTTSTAVDPALVLADAQKDAARLKAAVDEATKVI
jgi:predicted metal-dependent hydrolase